MAPYVLITDRGGHLHNSLMLIEQMNLTPDVIVTTYGPDIESLKKQATVRTVPYLFSWFGKTRFFNPLGFLHHLVVSVWLAMELKPRVVISLGASNVVFFCYFAKILGARVIHVDCMNQVQSPSVTGRLLYPICSDLFVQWPELRSVYGPKAKYEGWVL